MVNPVTTQGARPIFLSVGFGTLDSRLSQLFTRVALSLARYRSYRDAGSRDLMKCAGFRRDDPVFPDLAYSLPLSESRRSEQRESVGRVIGLSPLCYCHPCHWPRKDASTYEAYLQNLTLIVKWLVNKSYRVSMFASDSPDQFAIDDLWGLLSTTMSPEELGFIERHHVANVQAFLDHASRVELLVASRLHGVLLAQLAGTPVLALSYDRKVDVQMESVGQSFFRLPIDKIDMPAFEDRFVRLEASLDPVRQHLHARCSESRALLEAQYDAILQPRHES